MMWRFVWRNPSYAAKHWRRLAAVRRAMANHRQLHPTCGWCGTTKKIEVHHKVPVSVEPAWAAYATNLYTLCRTCHLAVGHLSNWRNVLGNVETVCAVADRIKVVKQS